MKFIFAVVFMYVSLSLADQSLGWDVTRHHSVYESAQYANVDATVEDSTDSNGYRTLKINYTASWGSLAEVGSFAFLSASTDDSNEIVLSVIGREVEAEVPSFVKSEISYRAEVGVKYKIYVFDGDIYNKKYIGEF